MWIQTALKSANLPLLPTCSTNGIRNAYKLSDVYEVEQKQLEQEMEKLTEVSEADTKVTKVAKLISITKKYARMMN